MSGGRLELIVGCVSAGKTEMLISRLRREQVINSGDKEVLIFKAAIDDRYQTDAVVSHNRTTIAGIPVYTTQEVRAHVHPYLRVVGLDEIQFFDEDIIEFCEELVGKGIVVIASGLNKTFQGEPFPLKQKGSKEFNLSKRTMGDLLGIADFITTLTAICDYQLDGTVCRADACYTQRLLDGLPAPYDDQLIAVGNKDEKDGRAYRARCRAHHFVPRHPRRPPLEF